MRTESIVTGTRTVLGTDFSVVDTIEREAAHRWRLTYGICNGIAGGTLLFRTRREALQAIGK